jgi:hypothetical protein
MEQPFENMSQFCHYSKENKNHFGANAGKFVLFSPKIPFSAAKIIPEEK